MADGSVLRFAPLRGSSRPSVKVSLPVPQPANANLTPINPHDQSQQSLSTMPVFVTETNEFSRGWESSSGEPLAPHSSEQTDLSYLPTASSSTQFDAQQDRQVLSGVSVQLTVPVAAVLSTSLSAREAAQHAARSAMSAEDMRSRAQVRIWKCP